MKNELGGILAERGSDYGPYLEECEKVAKMWSILLGVEVEPRMVPVCMIALKLVRESYRHKDDNLIDIQGYAKLANEMLSL